jgi:ATP-dependent Clp protease ATP-binding subunit ClpA
LLENPLAQEILAGRFKPDDVIQVDWQRDKIVLK